MLSATPLYAALLTILYLALSVRVIRARGSAGVLLGDGGDAALHARIRAQGNCAEYAPLGVLLLLIADLQGAPAMALHPLGLMLLAGRTLHAVSIAPGAARMGLRVAGMALTLAMLGITALGLLAHALI